jgi:hypothetical protein
MGHLRPRLRLAKVHHCYTIAQVAELYECHRNTVRKWLELGLEPIEPKKPILFHGQSLNEFHARRRREGKRPCAPGEIYCLPCRAPKTPAGGLFEFEEVSPGRGMVTAICPDCGRLMHQRVDHRRLQAFEAQARLHGDSTSDT